METTQNIREIMPGMTVEEMTALFFNKSALKEPPYKLYQLNSKGGRYYYTFDEKGEPDFFPSVTTIISETVPKNYFLQKWVADKGMDEAERYMNERASYGTFMHAQFEELLISRKYDLDGLKERLKKYIEDNRLPDDFIYYADDLKKDVLACAQWVRDYDVRPYAVEIALYHPEHRYAGMIDLVCSMLKKPGGEERVNAIVDFKSGKKGFFEEHEIQLHFYWLMWNANFPDVEINAVYNFAPKDWRKKPTYTLKDQTDSPNAAKIPALIQLAAIEDDKHERAFTSVSGVIDLDDEKAELTDNVISLTLPEVVKHRQTKTEETPDESDAVNVAEPVKEEPAPKDAGKPAKKRTKPTKGTTTPPNAKKCEIRDNRENLLNNDLDI